MTYIKITDFEIRKTPIPNDYDIINLELYINNSNFMTFPFSIAKIETEIVDKLKKAIDGKEVVINLSLDDSHKLFQITFK